MNVLSAALDQSKSLKPIQLGEKGHVEYAHGIPSRASLNGTDFSIIIPVEKGQLAKHADHIRVISYPAKIGDWLWEASTPASKTTY